MIAVSQTECPIITACNGITKMNCKGRVLEKNNKLIVNCTYFENALSDYCEKHILRGGTCANCQYPRYCTRQPKTGALSR
jgi:hypothetical protein